MLILMVIFKKMYIDLNEKWKLTWHIEPRDMILGRLFNLTRFYSPRKRSTSPIFQFVQCSFTVRLLCVRRSLILHLAFTVFYATFSYRLYSLFISFHLTANFFFVVIRNFVGESQKWKRYAFIITTN